MKTSLRAEYSNQIFNNISAQRFCLFSFFLLFFFQARAQQKFTFTFELKTDAKTSAGVYRRDSTLIRTLWNNVAYTSGRHTSSWDRKDDEGRLVEDTGLLIRVLSSNVRYTWEGVIGNTSDSFTGSTVIRMFDRMHGMAISKSTAYYTAGYTEGITSNYKFRIKDPQKKYNIPANGISEMSQASEFVTTDDSMVYWAGYDPFKSSTSFIFATKIANDSDVLFQNGSPLAITYGKTYSHAIDTGTGSTKKMIKGLAVQKKGKFLFAAHTGTNELHVMDKLSGALVQNISVSSPQSLAMDMNDSLWMISGNGVISKYGINSNGTLSSAMLTLSGFQQALDIAVSPDNKYIIVIDGGSSQQLKAFDNTSGAVLWTYGQAGGYATDPAVKDDKFYFSDTITKLSKPFIAFQPDNSFWVADVGNERIQHYASDRTFIDRIMSLPHSYSISADINDPARVFNEYLEFRIDYSKPLAPDNGSWTLVRNWRHGIREDNFREGMFNIFNQVVTLSNGRTYATLENAKNQNARYPEIVELPSSGQLIYTGVRFADFAGDLIETDGSLRRFVSTGQINTNGRWENQELTGFTNNAPDWGTVKTIASIPLIKVNDPANGNMSYPAMTSSGLLVLFDNGRLNQGFHLGAVKKGSNRYLWKTSHATSRQYEGPFPSDGAYDIGNHVEYAGGHVYAIDRNIFWNYHGEFWKSSQVNKWNHYDENGLMVGQFGITTPDGERLQKEAFPMGAGNVFSSKIVKVNDDYYLYHNDESVHAGIHRWKISGLNSVKEQTFSINDLSNASGGLNGSYFDGALLDNSKLKISMLHPVININKVPSQIDNSVDFSARYSGFVKSDYNAAHTFYIKCSKGCRLWMDGALLLDKWSNTSLNEFSTSLTLDANTLYPLKIEINGGTLALIWSAGSHISKQLIPPANLYPSYPDNDEEGLDLLEGLHSYSALENGLYGWERNPPTDDSTGENNYWRVKTNVKVYAPETPDLYMTFKRDNGVYTVSRKLADLNSCISDWKLSGQINFDGNSPSWDGNGSSYIDVLDDQGKIISRITCELTNDFQLFRTRLICNGESVFDAPYKDISPVLNIAQPFELQVSNTGVIFRYSDFVALGTSIFDAGSHWNKPKTLNFYFKGGTTNYKRAVDISELRFEGTGKSGISILGPETFCEGSSVILSAKKSRNYHWSNGSRAQTIHVSSSGIFFVTITDAGGCSSTSQAVEIKRSALPSPVISKKDGLLNSSIETGNQWYFKGQPIQGATSRTYAAKDSGVYMLVVTDSNYCSGAATYRFITSTFSPDILEKISILPNPSQGTVYIQVASELSGTIRIYNITGQLLEELPAQNTEINMRQRGAGIYTVLLSTGEANYFYKLLIQ